MSADAATDPRLTAAIDLIGRTGAKGFELRYDEGESDEQRTVWMAIAEWPHGWDAGAGTTPARAAMRLLDQVIDGGACAHCGRPTGVTDHWESGMPLAAAVCWYVFDPETEKFRRSCEGETEGRGTLYGMGPEGPVGRNDPCPCGSGRKWKKCHGAPPK
jgi:hypothetical protein